MNLSRTKQAYLEYYKTSHEEGFLDAKTKELIHIAALLATRCETWLEVHLAVARKMGITDEELAETVHLVSSVGAGSIVAMADRASRKVNSLGENKLSGLLR